MLDPLDPAHFFPVFADVLAALRESGGLDGMHVLGSHTLIALDGTEFHCSDNIDCPNCSHRKRGRKGVEYFHTLLAASIVAPGHNRAVPLAPEFVASQDGHEKQGLREPCGAPLAGRARRHLRPLEASLSWRRSVLAPADLRGGA